MKKVVVVLFFVAVVIVIGRNLIPFSNSFFRIHDTTQYARISEFTFNLKNGVIPPRLAPHMSFNLGYPILNFYAPFSYWVSSVFNLIGFSAVSAFKLSMLIALCVAFLGMILFLSQFFSFFPSILGSLLYSLSPWIATEIFVRGNLGEMWFLALLPLALALITKLSKKYSGLLMVVTTLVLSFLLTTHNALSLIGFGIVLLYSALLQQKKNVFLSIILALISTAYFWLPFIWETKLTYAVFVAQKTNFADHFLCVSQLWTTPFWGFGGSTAGCTDGMSFMLGKVVIIFGLLGMGLTIVRFKSVAIKTIFFILLLITVGASFLTLYQSAPVWQLLKPALSPFQFPWRFLPVALFGLAFFASFFLDSIKHTYSKYIFFVLLCYVVLNNQKYFTYIVSESKSASYYESNTYLQKKAAFEVPEYFPRTGDYEYWRSMELKDFKYPASNQSPFKKVIVITKPRTVTLDIHYFPYWDILIDEVPITPIAFDTLGRPSFVLKIPATIKITYNQTYTEKLGNIVTICSLIMLVIYATKRHA